MSEMRRQALILVLLVLLSGWVTCAVGNYRRPTKVSTRCCTGVNRAHIPNINSARIQRALHPCVEAVVFTTNNGKQFCTDPKATWVPDVLKAMNMTM